MTAYLQRLLERAAPVAAAPRPALASGSPVVAFDQRLGDPGLAHDYALTGAPPPEPAFPEEWPSTPSQPALSSEPGTADTSAPLRGAERGRAPDNAPATAPAADRIAAEPVPPSTVDTGQAAVEAPTAATPRSADRSPLSTPAALDPSPPPAAPIPPDPVPPPVALRFETRVERVREPTILELVTKPEREARSRAEPAPAAVERAPSPDREAPDPIAAQPVRPPASSDFARPVAVETAPAMAAPPLAEPVVAEPPPLAAPAASIDMSAIERFIAEAVRAERSRDQTAPTRQPERVQTTAEIPAAAPPRPATAAEASVIGKLQSSVFRPMLFGVRRR